MNTEENIRQDNTDQNNIVEEPSLEAQEIPFIDTLPQEIKALRGMEDVLTKDDFVNKITSLHKETEVPDEYEFNIPDGLRADDDLMKQFSSIAKESKLTKKQAESVVNLWNETQLNSLKKNEEYVANSSAKLKEEWKNNYEGNLKLAKNAAKHFGGTDLIDYLDSSGMGNHVPLIKAFKTIGESLKEDIAIGLNTKQKTVDIERWNGLPLLNFKM